MQVGGKNSEVYYSGHTVLHLIILKEKEITSNGEEGKGREVEIPYGGEGGNHLKREKYPICGEKIDEGEREGGKGDGSHFFLLSSNENEI